MKRTWKHDKNNPQHRSHSVVVYARRKYTFCGIYVSDKDLVTSGDERTRCKRCESLEATRDEPAGVTQRKAHNKRSRSEGCGWW